MEDGDPSHGKRFTNNPAHMFRECSHVTFFYIPPSTITRPEFYTSSLVYYEGKTTT